MNRRRGSSYLALALLTLIAAAPLAAVVQPEETPLRAKIFRHDSLTIDSRQLPAGDEQAAALAALGVAPQAAYLDALTGRWATLMPARPLLPGGGSGNALTWESFGMEEPPAAAARGPLAWQAFVDYLRQNQATLAIDTNEFTRPGNVTVHDGGALVQIHAPRQVDGIPVRDSYVTAVLRHGNLILFGSRNWADVTVSRQAQISADQARITVESYLADAAPVASFKKTHLALVPVTTEQGLGYRLAWVLRPVADGDLGNWEALVDAANGELLAFDDLNQYATSRVVEGGVLPETNDGMGPEGMEQAGWPMPFTDVTNDGQTVFTDAGGNLLACVDGDITSTLSGRFMNMADQCGAISETTAGDVLDFGTSPGTDCAVPPGGSPGNTHASRSGFYEMNRIKQQAGALLPSNSWIREQLTANMNINSVCNGFWDGSTVNFFRSGGGCGNTGELAGVYDHEWGHGMDDNDALPNISNPGEGIPDVHAYLRLNTSCIGRGFIIGGGCGGYGDPCVGDPPCSGVRDIDWANRASGEPHDLDWLVANCPSGGGPCGGASHCEGAAYAEAVFDLDNRDLPAVYGMDFNTSHEIATRLTYVGGGAVGTWFTCAPPFGGCNGDGGYLNFLAVDDDNGDLMDGTPHMSAIFAAFDRHQIACAMPVVQDAGCAGTPTDHPVVTATPADRGASLSWGAVADASSYKIYRTDGVFGCDFGKTLVGETTGTSFADSGLKNGREYSYTVIPMGPDDTCFGPASSCAAVTPAPGPNLAVVPIPSSLTILTGDGDDFLDNCEQLEVGVEVNNIGTGTQTNVRIISVEPISDPMAVLSELPLAVDDSMEACEGSKGLLVVSPAGLRPNDPLSFRVVVTSDELDPETRSQIITIGLATEGDAQFFATKTFSYEADPEHWQVVQGTFDRTSTGAGSGGDGSDNYIASSAFLGDQCDHIRSPVLTLAADSTLALWNNFDIEPFCDTCSPQSWYDRANVGLYDVASGARTLVEPSSGRLYNASGINGNCGTQNQPGWADRMETWASSGFSAADLDAGTVAGQQVQLDIRFGTDPLAHEDGFWFDQVTVTNVELQVGDTQSNACEFLMPIFLDGFETGDTSRWSNSVP